MTRGATFLVGRSGVVEALVDAIRSAGAPSTVLWIEGEAGTGKTSVLDAALVAGDSGTRALQRVLRARAEPMDPDRPFSVVSRLVGWPDAPADPGAAVTGDHVVERHGDRAVTVFDQLPGERHRIASDLKDRVIQLADAGPLVLVVDDVQWCDTSSLWILEGLLEGTEAVTVILAGRPVSETSPLGRRLTDRAIEAGTRWTLGPLDESEVDDLARHLLAAEPGDRVRSMLRRAEGNPMLVVELMRAAERSGWLVDAEGPDGKSSDPRSVQSPETGAPVRGSRVVDLDELARPEELEPRLVLTRLDVLAEEERELLRVASVLGSTFTLAQLAVMLGRPSARLVPVLERLMGQDLLVSDGAELGFRHDLVRESVYDEIAEWARAALHAHAAAVLRTEGSPDHDVAHHLRRGSAVLDDSAAGAFARAGRTLLHTDPSSARALLEHAVALVPDPDSGLVADLVLSTTWAGDPGEGEVLAREHLAGTASRVSGAETDHTGPAGDGPVRYALANNLVAQGRLAEAAGEVELLAGSIGDEALRVLLAECALLRALAFQHERAESSVRKVLGADDAGPSEGTDLAACVAWCARSWTRSLAGHADSSVLAAERAVESAAGAEVALRFHPHYFLAQALLGADEFERFDEVAAEGRALSARLGTVWQLPVWSSTIAAKHLRSGEWDMALAEAEVGLGWARDTGSRVGVPWLWCHQALIALWRGAMDDAGSLLAKAEESLGGELRPGAEGVLWVRGLLAEERGDLDVASTSLGTLWDLIEGLGVVARMPTIGPDVVRVALAVGDRGRAVRVVEALDLHGDVAGPPSFSAGADRCRGLLGDDPDVMVRACAGYAGSPAVTESAMAEADAAIKLAATGDLERASVHARVALSGFDRLGAGRLKDRLGRSVGDRVLGSDRVGKDPRTLLSPAELRVAGLVAAGASNPEVASALHVSRRTVESHLSHIFTKLGIRSRVDLAVLMADHR